MCIYIYIYIYVHLLLLYSLHNILGPLLYIHVNKSVRRSSPISVTKSRVIPFAWWTDSHYSIGLSASYQLTTVYPASLVSCFCYLNIYVFLSTLFVSPVSFLVSVSQQLFTMACVCECFYVKMCLYNFLCS